MSAFASCECVQICCDGNAVCSSPLSTRPFIFIFRLSQFIMEKKRTGFLINLIGPEGVQYSKAKCLVCSKAGAPHSKLIYAQVDD